MVQAWRTRPPRSRKPWDPSRWQSGPRARYRPAGPDHKERFGLILSRHDRHPQIQSAIEFERLLDVGRAGRRHDRLALEVADRADLRFDLRDETARRQKMRIGVPDLLLPLGVVGGVAAFEVDRAVGQ